MAKLRVTVEWMFKDITSTWAYLKFQEGLRVKQQPVGLFYIVAADLTNLLSVLRGRNQTSQYFGINPPSLEEYLIPRDGVGEAVFNVPDVLEPPAAMVQQEELAVGPQGNAQVGMGADDLRAVLDMVAELPNEMLGNLLTPYGDLDLEAARQLYYNRHQAAQ